MRQKMLRDLVQQRVGRRWLAWAQAHPHLAEVIDRTRLVEATVARLSGDEELRSALERANLDEAQLAAAARLLEKAESAVDRVLGT
ncbi:MAG: hypothetical protein ACOCTI_07520 [Phycisphaeraceae bacterium]